VDRLPARSVLSGGVAACPTHSNPPTPHGPQQAYGGDNSPYVYVDLGGKKSWDMFSEILEKAQIVTTPGAGFGPGGEGFIRLSAFASKENVDEACTRLQKVMAK
jgi:aspartate/methionine/tyrosine aminotransferase